MSCITPFYVDNPQYGKKPNEPSKVPVPCGKCPPCLLRRSASWCFRMLQEDKISKTAYFVTLTYSPENITMTPNGFMTVVKKDVQDFMKRLRRAQFGSSKGNIKYYAAAEYGDAYERPHYHLILFNADHALIDSAWGKGKVTIDPVNGKTVAYTTKYINKGKLVPKHSRDDRTPEFSLMSQKLGANYMSPDIVNYHKADLSRNYVVSEGFKISMPRYYRLKIYDEKDREVQQELTKMLSHEKQELHLSAYVRRTGSSDGYDFSKHEAVKAQLTNFKNRQKTRTAF